MRLVGSIGALIFLAYALAHAMGQPPTGGLFRNDGVLVRKGGEARSITATWQLVVLITPPVMPRVDRWIVDIERCLDKADPPSWSGKMENWRGRMEAVKIQLAIGRRPDTKGAARRRRSPFDFIGAASSWLFGTVTQNQLDHVDVAIKQGQLRSTAMEHNQKAMLSMMNQTRHIEKELAHRIQQVETNVRDALGLMKRSVDAALYRMRLEERMSRVIGTLEAAMTAHRTNVARYHRMEIQLESGELTEDLLNRDRLRSVLIAAGEAGFEALPMRWYYSHATVAAVWGEEEKLAFSVALPMITPERYLLFHLRYLPVRLDEAHVRTIVGASKVAVSTDTRANFLPDHCRGSEPEICWPVREATVEGCEASLVTGGKSPGCRVAVRRRPEGSATVLAPKGGTGLTAVAPHVEETIVQLRCPGQTSTMYRVTAPTMLALPGGCVLEGDGWRLRSVRVHRENMVIFGNESEMVLPPLEMKWPKTLHTEIKQRLKFHDEIQVPMLDFTEIVDIPPVASAMMGGLHMWSWVGMGTVVPVLAIIAIIICCIKRKVCRGRKRTEKREEPTVVYKRREEPTVVYERKEKPTIVFAGEETPTVVVERTGPTIREYERPTTAGRRQLAIEAGVRETDIDEEGGLFELMESAARVPTMVRERRGITAV